MNHKKIIMIIFIVIVFFILSVIFALLNFGSTDILSGISIGNINVSGNSKENTTKLLKNLITERDKTDINLEYTTDDNKYEKKIDLSILNIEYNIENSVNKAYNIGRNGNIFKCNYDIVKTIIFKKNIDIDFSIDEKKLDNLISDISSNLPNKMIQSGYYIEDKNLIITKGSSGFIVDKEAFTYEIYSYINNLNDKNNSISIPVKFVEPEKINLEKIHSEVYKEAKDAYFEKNPFKVYAEVKGIDFDLEKAQSFMQKNNNNTEFTIQLKYTEPKVKLKNLKIDVFPNLLSSFSTRFDENNKERSNNLNIAASKIDGTILAPGEEFSYNKIVGERSIAAGYKEAKIYQGGKVIDGLGGGICQISSTLYNAVVCADLDVTERYNHQFITSYVQPGRDATVAYGSKDFKFKNNRTYPIRIDVYITSGIAKVDIYGIKEKEDKEIDIDVETISTIPYETKYQTDSSLPSNTEKLKQRGANGVIVKAYKLVKQNGITISKSLLSKDSYIPLDKIILKSSKKWFPIKRCLKNIFFYVFDKFQHTFQKNSVIILCK